jgi:hypothetical protein
MNDPRSGWAIFFPSTLFVLYQDFKEVEKQVVLLHDKVVPGGVFICRAISNNIQLPPGFASG